MSDLDDELQTFRKALRPDDVPDPERWYIGASSGSKWLPYAPSLARVPGEEPRGGVLRLRFFPTGGPSSWIRQMNYIVISYASRWDSEYELDNDPDTDKKYLVGGPLIDPVVTSDLGSATKAVADQSSRVEDGAIVNYIFEVLHAAGGGSHLYRWKGADEYEDSLPSADELPDDIFKEDVETRIPISTIEGIGRKTIERFSRSFAVYPNLISAEREDFSGLLPGYDHSPDLNEMQELVSAIADQYKAQAVGWPELDQFSKYPIGTPIKGEL